MTPRQRRQLGLVLRRIGTVGHGDPHAVSLIESKVFETSAERTSTAAAAATADAQAWSQARTTIGQLPTTARALDGQITAAAAAQDAASRATRAAHQAASVVISTIVKLIELSTPVRIPNEAAQMVAESLFENWAETAEPRVSQGFEAFRSGMTHLAQALTAMNGSDVAVDTPATFLHRGMVVTPEAIAHAAPPVPVGGVAYPHGDPASDVSDLRALEDLHF
jgi:hypothetical protein